MKALAAMYSPGGKVHGPMPTFEFYMHRLMQRIGEAFSHAMDTSSLELACLPTMDSHGGGLMFPIDLAP